MNSPTVWIAQEPMRKENGTWVSKGLDIASANMYGEVQIVWGPDASILGRAEVENIAVRAAMKYDPSQDYVVALGSPSLIAMLAWAIGCEKKTLRILEWDRALQRYYPTLRSTLQQSERNINGNR